MPPGIGAFSGQYPMDICLLEYEYPDELVAQRPLADRSASRMMVVDRTRGQIEHSRISDIPTLIEEGDLIVLNDSRVVPARIFGRRSTGEEIELLVVEPADGERGLWRCLLKRARRIRAGEKLFFGMQATGIARGREGTYLLVEFRGNALDLAMEHHGVPPLPPYIMREGYEAYTEEDRERYQTVYAEHPGSAAAPTAGLHLTEDILRKLKRRGVEMAMVTLHVGIDTFTPVREQNAGRHRMHGERVRISQEASDAISRAMRESRRIIAVGTTTTRALESAMEGDGVRSGEWVTDLYILPGYEFRVVGAMLTNFHQPRSTLLALVAAFAGRDRILSCYREAIASGYRLFSYGDCMFIV